MKRNKICVLACFIAVLAGCATSPPKPTQPVSSVEQPSSGLAASGIRVGHLKDGVSRPLGTYVLIKKNHDAWEVVAIDPPNSRADPKQRKARDGELLYVSENYRYVAVDFYIDDILYEEGKFICFVFGGNVDEKDYHPNPCNSDLTSNVDQLNNAAKQALGAVLTLGITTLATNTRKSVDAAKVFSAMESANVIPRVKYHRYKQQFAAARSNAQLQAFIDRYQDDDPDYLVLQANVSLMQQIEAERMEKEQRALAAALKERKERQEAELRRNREQREAELALAEQNRRAAALKARTAQFRASLQAGDESHCGLVVEVKKPVVKLQTMIGEYWLRIDQVYSAGDHPCRFINGQYAD